MTQPVLVMIHGLMGSLVYFEPERRIRGAEVHAPSLLGYGEERGADVARLTLQSQAEHVARYLAERTRGEVWVVAHSMGGAVATVLLDQFPDRIVGLINHEGNFTLKDAFWSRAIAAMDLEAWRREFARMGADPAGWLARSGIAVTPERLAWAAHIPDRQPAETVQAMSRAVVAETGAPAYLEAVRRIVDRGIPIHLVAGERSAASWDVPDFVRRAARSYSEIPGAGHLSMLEAPDAFCSMLARLARSGTET